MPITIVIPKEIKEGEKRVAMVPSIAVKLAKLGVRIKIQHDAGKDINADDAAYKDTTVEKDAAKLYSSGDMVIKIQPPTDQEISYMKEGAVLVSALYPHTNPGILKLLVEKRITCFALEMIPRISRAQSMDILSSQATIAGYKAVLIAADAAKFFLPMLTTAAGTIKPANVLVIGAGVAGLQAIATAKRLGARVEAYDVRRETKQEIESLGARFVETGVVATGAGGYARELTDAERKQQQEALAKKVASSDVVITTAGVPGKSAPKIISKKMLESMSPGAIVVDIMAEMGGNCELSKPGETVIHNQVTIVGTRDITSSLATHASEMFARNVVNFISPMLHEGELTLNWEDEVIAGSAATHEGKIVHKAFKQLVEV